MRQQVGLVVHPVTEVKVLVWWRHEDVQRAPDDPRERAPRGDEEEGVRQVDELEAVR